MPEEPAISVLSRSKKAAPLPPPLPEGSPSVSGSRLGAVDLDEDGIALAAPCAARGATQAAAAATQLVHERADDAGAGGTDGVAERDRATVDVDLVLVDLEHPHGVDRDRREGLVDLPEVHVAGLLADLLERLHRRLGGSPGEIGEIVGDLAIGQHSRDRALAILLRPLVRGDDHGAGAVVHTRRVAGRVRRVVAAD